MPRSWCTLSYQGVGYNLLEVLTTVCAPAELWWKSEERPCLRIASDATHEPVIGEPGVNHSRCKVAALQVFAIRLLKIVDRYTELVFKVVSDRFVCMYLCVLSKKTPPKQVSPLLCCKVRCRIYINFTPYKNHKRVWRSGN